MASFDAAGAAWSHPNSAALTLLMG